MTFTGVPSTRTRVGSQIRAADMTNTAADAEYIRNRLLNVDHHANAGNRLFHPIVTAAFGGSDAVPEMYVPSATAQDARIFSTLFYIPQSLVDVELCMVLNANKFRRFAGVVRDDTLTEVTRFAFEPFENGVPEWGMLGEDWHVAQFTVSSSGVYCVDVATGFQGGTPLDCFILGLHIGPIQGPVSGPYPAPDAQALSAHTIRAWQTVDPATTAVDGPMGQAVQMVNENMARLIEEATGMPVPGNASRTATPHVHDGTTGVALDQCVASLTMGITGSAVTGVSVVATGNNSLAPRSNSNVKDTVAQFTVRTPVRAYTTANTTFPPGATTSKLRCAVLVDNDTTKSASRCWVEVGDLAGAGAMRFKAASDGRLILTTADTTAPYQSSLNFSSGDYSTYYVAIRADNNGGTLAAGCHAVLLYLEE